MNEDNDFMPEQIVMKDRKTSYLNERQKETTTGSTCKTVQCNMKGIIASQ